MGPFIVGDHGGINGLLEFLDNHQEAVEYHLITMGLRLDMVGSPALSWRDLLVIVRRSPPGSPIHYSLDRNAAWWDSGQVTPYLLAHIADVLAMGNWQRGGKKNAPKPKPVPRPGDKPKGAVFGSEPIPVSEFDAWWEAGEGNEG